MEGERTFFRGERGRKKGEKGSKYQITRQKKGEIGVHSPLGLGGGDGKKKKRRRKAPVFLPGGKADRKLIFG